VEHVSFKVQGSEVDPYDVTFVKNGTSLTAKCTCRAGAARQYCKHRFSILDGVTTGIVSGNGGDVDRVKSWLAGTELETVLQELAGAEAQVELATKTLSAVKKKVARTMDS